MARITVKIKGLNKLRRAFEKHPAIVGQHVSIAINRTIESIRAKTAPLTPVDSGRLVGSFARDSRRASPTRLIGAVASNVPYAGFVHDVHPPGRRYKNPTRNKSAVAGFLVIGTRNARGDIDRHFQDAGNNITKALAG